ncbi:uncharacterized protein Z520_10095 [Fonsecaea multimorphosa CBS 102226]|uniref:Uncharacterized protein n=1 Tax=Fonsecaea multimorphosa CBS 102226 TaxID=1442371 RepID=A0A0D2JU92_9EURO|nr:uncharacterized protein Z520_10095 [Fonsecaea multimorphosa CBS 102226]KIX94069.1 hypothetical protein Z520_10095 [Fonsecaea multimorphosa CBS 102226]OAL19422.1 hypothetical protein AYO22_09584 [Fonsecaea multimorphosa]
MAPPLDDLAAIFNDLGDLERDFAQVEIDSLRRKEFHSRPLYSKRAALFERIPDFWPTVFGSGPEDIRQFFSPDDLPLIASIKSFSVDRYQIKTETEGEPRSVRFTFRFAPNEFMEDTSLVKEFEYRTAEDGPGNLISKPVPIKWKGKKKDPTRGLLDAAVELYKAEEALKLKNGDKLVEIVDREALWQYEKLLVKLEEDETANQQPSFFSWFGFRGAVNAGKSKRSAGDRADGSKEEEEDDGEDESDEMPEFEIFPAGAEVANALAEDLWPDAMDYFLSAGREYEGVDDEDEDEEEDEDDAPELVLAEDDDRPRKKPRNS